MAIVSSRTAAATRALPWTVRSTVVAAYAALWGVGGLVVIAPARAQTMPGPVYHDLANRGHERLARRIASKLELRADPDAEGVSSLLDRWEREAGGPDSGYDWLAVARLWLRAGDADRAAPALQNAEASGEVTAGELFLDRARVDWLAARPAQAAEAYWRGCELAAEAGSQEYWLDVEPLATPAEAEEWDDFRRLPIGQRDLCALLRRFWNERALASAVTVEERMRQHYARLRYALDNYRRRGSRKPPTLSNRLGRPVTAAFDDRGLIYLRMGEPDRVSRFSGNPDIGRDAVSAECYQPNVSWAFDYPDGTRVYHFTSFGGLDDYWLIENLGLVYRCGDPSAVIGEGWTGRLTPVNESRFLMMGPWASLVLQDLYRSRQGADPRYARLAQQMARDPDMAVGTLGGELGSPSEGSEANQAQQVLQEERVWTWADAEYAITEVPERPNVAANTRILVEELQFRGTVPGATRVWLNGVVEADNLTPTADGDVFRYRVDVRWVILDERGEQRQVGSSFEASAPRRLGEDESLPVRVAAELPPGRYRYTVAVSDAMPGEGASRRAGNYRRSDLLVRDVDIGPPTLSDVAVAADSGGMWSPGGGVNLRASPAHLTGPDGVAFIYFEVYNLTRGSGYVTRVRLEPEADGDAFDLSFPGDVAGDASVTRRLLRLDLSDTEPGSYRMIVTVRDEASGTSTLPYRTGITVDRRS